VTAIHNAEQDATNATVAIKDQDSFATPVPIVSEGAAIAAKVAPTSGNYQVQNATCSLAFAIYSA